MLAWIQKQLVLLALGRIQLPRELLRLAFKRFAQRPALACDGIELNFAQLGQRVHAMAQALQSLGVQVAQPVVVWLDEEAFVCTRLAALECGAAFVGLGLDADMERVEQVMQWLDAKVLVHRPQAQVQVSQLLARHADWLALAAALPQHAAGAEPNLPPPVIGPDQVAGYALTSGTTGRPKVVPATHALYLTSMRLLVRNARPGSAPRGPLKTVVAVPFTGAGSGLLLLSVVAGGCLVRVQRYDAESIARAIEQHRANAMFITPSLLIDLLDYLQGHSHDLSCLQSITYGTEWMPTPKLEEALRRFGPILQQGFGCTEVLPPVAGLSAAEHWVHGAPAPRSVLSALGRASRSARLRVADEEGQTVADGVLGELLIQSPTQFTGYLGQPELSARVLRDGWYHSGDMAFRSADGLFHGVGRKDDLIVRAGHSTYPRTVEECLHEHEAIKETAYVQVGGRAVMAVSLRQQFRADAAACWPSVCAYLSGRVAEHDLPEEYVLLPDLPRSPNGKLLRRQVREQLGAKKGPADSAARPFGS